MLAALRGVRVASGLARPVRCASSLIVAEHDGTNVSAGTLAAVTAATKLGGDVSMLVLGSGVDGVAQKAAAIPGVNKVLTANNEALQHRLAENVAKAVVAAAKKASYTHILAPSSNHGKNYLPRAAALLDVSPLSDITGVISEDKFTRPCYAGNAIQTVKMSDNLKMLLVRTTAFEKAAVEGGNAQIADAGLAADDMNANKSRFVSESVSKSTRPELGNARVVVSGGRGMKSGENFALLEKLADKLQGAVGASRAAVDAGFVPNEYQVGQTGKVVAPELYIAVGISGAIQHLSGMKDSKVIVAINKDKEAPIFQVADYGLVDDLFNAVPQLTEKL